jgi:hypothetical protein
LISAWGGGGRVAADRGGLWDDMDILLHPLMNSVAINRTRTQLLKRADEGMRFLLVITYTSLFVITAS